MDSSLKHGSLKFDSFPIPIGIIRHSSFFIRLSSFALALFSLAATPLCAADNAPIISDAPDTIVVEPKTEEIIKGALKYMAAQQAPNGAWSGNGGEHPVAMTGYALMAFMACGNLPTGGEYARAVSNGVGFLLANVREDGFINSMGPSGGNKQSNMYDHGIATIALGEVYGQTQDALLKAKLGQAVKLILASQSSAGGWRYNPRPESADISVTVLQLVALRCAKNAGFDVPQSTIDHAVEFVRTCYDEGSGGFTYEPHNHAPGFARTAAAIYSLQVCGIYNDPKIATGSRYLLQNKNNDEFYTYGHFYAAPAQYMIGGDTWKQWYAQMNEKFCKDVKSFDKDPTLKYWTGVDGNAQGVGAIYPTAIYTTVLAIPYHYIPLYQR